MLETRPVFGEIFTQNSRIPTKARCIGQKGYGIITSPVSEIKDFERVPENMERRMAPLSRSILVESPHPLARTEMWNGCPRTLNNKPFWTVPRLPLKGEALGNLRQAQASPLRVEGCKQPSRWIVSAQHERD